MEYHTPGVYIREVDSGPKPIASVATSVAGFLGLFIHNSAQTDGVAISATDGRQTITGKVQPQLVDSQGTISPANAAGAVAELTTAFKLRRSAVKDLRKLMELNGHRATFSSGGEGKTKISVGKAAVEVDASVVNTEGKVVSNNDRVVDEMLNGVQGTFALDRPQPRTAKDLLEVFGLTFQSVRGHVDDGRVLGTSLRYHQQE